MGESADFTYVEAGMDQWQNVAVFPVDNTKITKDAPLVLTWEVKNKAGEDVKDTRAFNIALKNGDAWNSEAVGDWYGKTGGEYSIVLAEEQATKIKDSLHVHITTSEKGFDGTFTLKAATVNDISVTKAEVPTFTYEGGMGQWAPTAVVNLPSDIDFSKYTTCRIEFETSDKDFTFHGMVNAGNVEDPQYDMSGPGLIEVTLDKVKTAEVSNPFVKLNTGEKGFTGSVKITKVTFLAE